MAFDMVSGALSSFLLFSVIKDRVICALHECMRISFKKTVNCTGQCANIPRGLGNWEKEHDEDEVEKIFKNPVSSSCGCLIG